MAERQPSRKQLFQMAHDEILTAKSVLIACPSPVDMDAYGFTYALGRYLADMEKDVRYVCESKVPDQAENRLYRFLPQLSFEDTWPDPLPQLVFTGDYGSFSTVKLPDKNWFPSNVQIFGFDHHAVPASDFPDHGIQITDPDATATTVLLYHFLTYSNTHLTKALATAILLGIFTDSRRFTRKMNADAHRIVAECIDTGAPMEEIRDAARPVFPRNRFRVWRHAFNELAIDGHIRTVFLFADQDKLQRMWGGREKDVLTFFGTVMEPLGDADIAVLYLEEARGMYGWRVMIRSRNPEISAHELAVALKPSRGGGGHPDQAVARISTERDGHIESVHARLRHKIAELQSAQRT